jgi:hypothetical protein
MLFGWPEVLESMRGRYRADPRNLSNDPTLVEYVTGLPREDRIPLLLAAYRRYRELGPPPEEFCAEHYFESSAHSLLISRILASQTDVTEEESCSILHSSFHFCGHGGDVVGPIRLAERAFAGKSYTVSLFDAARAYRKTLQGLISVQARLAKQELDWVLWHDPRYPEKRCWTRRLQLSFPVMGSGEAFVWQWMLRHTTHTLNRAPGKAWLAEAECRLDALGPRQYRNRLDEWFVFHEGEPVRLSPSGSNILRLLVSYGVFVPAAAPAIGRLNCVNWASPDTSRKVLTTLAWLKKQW